jgi:hypothetical protein
MRKAELKKLLEKITECVGKKLRIMNIEGWTDKEIAEQTGVAQNRLTEIKKFEKYRRPLSEKFLVAFIIGGIITVDQLKEKIDMTEVEEAYTNGLKYFETKGLREKCAVATDLGINVENLIDQEIARVRNSETT